MALGGVFLFIAAMLMVGIVFYLWLFAQRGETEYPMAVNDSVAQTPRLLERWPVWVSIAVCLVLVAYGFPIYETILHAPPGSPGIKTW